MIATATDADRASPRCASAPLLHFPHRTSLRAIDEVVTVAFLGEPRASQKLLVFRDMNFSNPALL
jgi:hypothetical protein